MVQMMFAGLKYPVTSAVCGATWVIGRVIYGYGGLKRESLKYADAEHLQLWMHADNLALAGYAKGGPEGRMAGGLISHLGDFPLVFVCFKVAYDLI